MDGALWTLLDVASPPTIYSGGTPACVLLASEGITAPSNLVAAWDDQGTSNNDASQATSGARPTWDATGGPLSDPTVAFASGKYLIVADASSMRPSGAWTVFVVAKRDSALAYQCLLNPTSVPTWTNGWCGLTCLADGTTLRAWVGNYASGGVDYATDTGWHLYELAYHGDGTFSFLVDGTAVGAGTGTPSAGGDLAIGAGVLSTGPTVYSYQWRGKISALLWGVPTSDVAKRSKVRLALARRYGLVVS